MCLSHSRRSYDGRLTDMATVRVIRLARGDAWRSAGPQHTVISNSGMSLERSEIGDAKRVDRL